MPLPEPGKLYVPVAGEVRDQILSDIRLEAISRGLSTEPPIQPGTDNYQWAVAFEGPFLNSQYNADLRATSGDPRNATGTDLDDIRKALGLAEVPATGSSGKIRLTVSGTGNVPADTQLALSNGKRIKVVGTWSGLSNNAEIDVTAIDSGEDTNVPGGELVRFVNAPINIDTEARVSSNVPLTGGTDTESDERKRTRILNRLANPPGGGNWSQKRETVLEALSSVQDAFVYPALGGPASELIVPVRDFDPDNFDFSRALSTPAMSVIRSAVYAKFGSPDEIVIKPPVDQSCDVALELSIPEATGAGGDGTGWSNVAVWPILEAGDNGRVTVSNAAFTDVIIVTALTVVAPVNGVTRIAWWSRTCRKFYRRLVVSSSGSAGAYTLTLDAPLIDDSGASVAVGDFISPDATNIEGYGKTWIEIMRTLGPGEATADANRLPRSKRHPYLTSDTALAPDLKTSKLALLKDAHTEILDYGYGYRSATTPTIPATVATAPSVLVPRHFGVYKQ